MKPIYFEDINLHEKKTAGEYQVTREEVMAYARKWDPQPFHVDEAAAKASPYGGLIASAAHTMAISFWLLNQAGKGIQAIGGAGWEKMKLIYPVRPGDRLSLVMECIEKRVSRSKPDRGIVRHAVTVSNQDGFPVTTFETVTLVKRRPSPRPGSAPSAHT